MSDGALSASNLNSGGYVAFGGRWVMNLDRVGNVVLNDGVTGLSWQLTNLPISSSRAETRWKGFVS